ncbi:MAG: transporter ATP-binding protein [Chloroflexota bacterium]|nr:transporter ATP-binding protein [Chloroflexota bacterium]
MIRFSHITFAYPNQPPIFQNFNWQVEPGEAWAVIGPSGCGKSTLLYLAAGLRQPGAGQILVAGQLVPRPRASTGLVLQDFGLLPWATVWENAALVMRMGQFYRRKRVSGDSPRPYPRPDVTPDQVNRWLARLGIADQRDKYPNQISGGQRQRAAIARSLLQQPNLLLMDEPFSSLDAFTREDLQRLTLELRQETGVTTVIVTHNIEEAVYLGQRILVLGRAPNTATRTVENANAGTLDFRDRPTYQQKCAELRAVLAVG